MTEPATLMCRLDETAALFEMKLGARGATLREKLNARGRALPRHVRRQASILVEAEGLGANPRLAMLTEDQKYFAAADAVDRHLTDIDLADRRKGWWLGMLGSMAFNILAVLVLFLTALVLLGFV